MEYIQRLPFILGGLAAFITGLISYLNKSSQQEAYIQMIIALFLFFILGLYTRGILKGIFEEIEEKKKEDERRRKEEEIAAQHAAELEAQSQGTKGGNIDIKIEDQ